MVPQKLLYITVCAMAAWICRTITPGQPQRPPPTENSNPLLETSTLFQQLKALEGPNVKYRMRWNGQDRQLLLFCPPINPELP